MLEAHPQLDLLCIAIGGGGLISGIATAAKAINPAIDVVGVETMRFPSMYAPCARAGQVRRRHHREGIAVKEPGVLTRAIVEKLVWKFCWWTRARSKRHRLAAEIEKTVVEERVPLRWRP